MIDASMVTEMTPMSSRVAAALALLGFLKAGTPLEIASTPVSAAHPEEKARSSRNMAASPTASCPGSATSSRPALGAWPKVPVNPLMNPHTPMPMMPNMKA